VLQDSSTHRRTPQRFGSANLPAVAVSTDVRSAAWIDFCQVLQNAIQFLYVD
jgi:hypothetical protein